MCGLGAGWSGALRGRAFRAEQRPVPTRGRAFGGEPAYRILSAARLCLLVFSR
jgi:hypothetical protein